MTRRWMMVALALALAVACAPAHAEVDDCAARAAQVQTRTSWSPPAFDATALPAATREFRGVFDPGALTGDLLATALTGSDAGGGWSAAEMLDAKSPDARLMLTFDIDAWQGVPFRAALADGRLANHLTEAHVAWVRGERTVEALPELRERPATRGLLGSIVRSGPVYVAGPPASRAHWRGVPGDYAAFAATYAQRRPVVYAGSNSGILHGFAADTGEELIAYVPNLLIDPGLPDGHRLLDVAAPDAQYQSLLDWSPRVNDVYVRPGAHAIDRRWMTVLVGGLGGGGRGYFALDVTDPDTWQTEDDARRAVMWEFSARDAVGAQGEMLMGHSAGEPVVALTNVPAGTAAGVTVHEWAVIAGNGYGTERGVPTLLVLFIERGLDGWGTDSFVVLPVARADRVGVANGLGEPVAVDRDRDGTVDLVYAGDRLGNLYRFDLSAPDPAVWTATYVYTAVSAGGQAQAIQGRPAIMPHPSGNGFVVVFTAGDPQRGEAQDLHGVWDPFRRDADAQDAETSAWRLDLTRDGHTWDGVPRVAGRVRIRDGVVLTSVHRAAESGCWLDDGELLAVDALTGGEPNRAVFADSAYTVAVADLALVTDLITLDGAAIAWPPPDLMIMRGVGDYDWLLQTMAGTTRPIRVMALGSARIGRLSWQELDRR